MNIHDMQHDTAAAQRINQGPGPARPEQGT